MRVVPRLASGLLAVCGLYACGQQGVLRNAGLTGFDGGVSADTGTPPADTGTPPDDTGPAVDTGPAGDTGPAPDTGQHDAGDAGPPADTGPPADVGPLPTWMQMSIDNTIQHGQGIEIVDINKDNNNDVVVALSFSDQVRVYRNRGPNMGFEAITISPSIVAVHVATADFDGDTNLDVAAVGLFARAGGPGEVAVYKNPGMLNTMTAWTSVSVSGAAGLAGARFVDAADLTGDGRADIVVSTITASGTGVVWYLNNGDGSQWTGPSEVDPALRESYAVITHDVDNDMVQDVIATSKDDNEVNWYENDRTNGTMSSNLMFTKHVIGTPRQAFGMALANLDADAAMEVIVTSADGTLWFDPGADPKMPWTRRVIDANFGSGDNARLFAADMNRDGRVDVAVASQVSQTVRVYYRLSNGNWSSPSTVVMGLNGLTNLAGGDINGDMRPDLITTTYDNAGGPMDRLDLYRNTP